MKKNLHVQNAAANQRFLTSFIWGLVVRAGLKNVLNADMSLPKIPGETMMKTKNDFCYNMNGYPEPEHIYLGNSSILVFTLFPQRQESHPLSEYNPNESFYKPDEPLLYDIEFRAPFKEDAEGNVVRHPFDIPIEDWYLAKGVTIDVAHQMCDDFISQWCNDKGLALI